MGVIPKSLKALTLDLQRLPGIGPKSARRIAYHLFSLSQDRLDFLSQTIEELKRSVMTCSFCRILSDTDPCEICGDPSRVTESICIVEDHMDVYAIERAGGYKGLYFVLGTLLSPTRGVSAEDIHIEQLVKRIKQLRKEKNESQVIEIILALSPTTEGQTTALYIKEYLLHELDHEAIKIMRVAIGLSVGSAIDYVDSFTLQEALRGRSLLE